jgi:thiaminase (transcriptional activator TenA)
MTNVIQSAQSRSAATPDDVCAYLRAEASTVWERLFSHPFVLGMAQGTLPPRAFGFYIGQNILFLQDLARTMALGVAKAGDEETLREFATATGRVLELELPENRALLVRVQALEPAASEASVMAPTNLAYTRHLQTVGYRESSAHVAAALLPCTWSYGEIGQALVGRAVDHPVYAEWFRFFASAEYWTSVHAAQAQLRRLTAGLGPTDVQQMADIFITSSQLEYAFWDMALAEETWSAPRR